MAMCASWAGGGARDVAGIVELVIRQACDERERQSARYAGRVG